MASIRRYGLVEPLVVRPMPDGTYEIFSGNQRLQAQALNHIHGEDDLGLRAELLRQVLASIPQGEVQALLPETAGGLDALASLVS